MVTLLSFSPALLADLNVLGELLLFGFDDRETIVVHIRDARFVTVAALRSVNDGLLVEGLGEFANGRGHGRGMAERLMISGGDGRGGEEGEEELHGWLVGWRGLGLEERKDLIDAVLFCARNGIYEPSYLPLPGSSSAARAITAADENPNFGEVWI